MTGSQDDEGPRTGGPRYPGTSDPNREPITCLCGQVSLFAFFGWFLPAFTFDMLIVESEINIENRNEAMVKSESERAPFTSLLFLLSTMYTVQRYLQYRTFHNWQQSLAFQVQLSFTDPGQTQVSPVQLHWTKQYLILAIQIFRYSALPIF